MYKLEIVKSIILNYFTFITFLFLSLSIYAQPNKRTNHWFFKDNIGIDFNSGIPVQGSPCPLDSIDWGGTSTMSDTNGNLLFYSDGEDVYNKDHEKMQNSWAGEEFSPGIQGALCMPKPGSENLFYVFTVCMFQYYQPINFYHTIDMSLNDGLGGIVDTDTIPSAWDACEQLNASYFRDKSGYWIIMRKYREHKYAAWKVTDQGLDPNPVLSVAPNRYFSNGDPNMGYMKISYDKKYIVFMYTHSEIDHADIEICKFNNDTGEIVFLYSFQLKELFTNNPNYRTSNGDFSPDSKFFYLAGRQNSENVSRIFQFDMQYIEDEDAFKESIVKIGEPIGYNLQLASNGKIYCFANGQNDNNICVINKPDRKGLDCVFEENVLTINYGGIFLPFVNFAPDFLHRFDFDGICESDTFTFDPWFFPEPTSIQWNFGDPASGTNNTSFDKHPTHKFTDGGIYEVSVYVVYPNGRVEETSREVEVEYSPEPNLGPDTTICNFANINLDAECGPHQYVWSTGQFGTSQITVSDTGWYWVEVTSDGGCFGYDSIHISNFVIAIADTSNLILSPTTCGGSTGAIRGLEIAGAPPFSYQWYDDLGNPISASIDLYQLPVGNYTLQVTDGNNCQTTIGPYSIIDAGDVLVAGVDFTDEHCNQQDGSIIVTATSGLGDMLYYSIDNGSNYYQNLGVFENLPSGSYAVRVHDSTMCEDAYVNNPVIINNILHPDITDVEITAETAGMNNGQINIIANSPIDTIYFSNDAGSTSQINNGLFTNLAAGFYTCVVSDKFGCDTTFIVEVPEDITIKLEAIAGEDGVCPGTVAHVPLLVSNFSDVKNFVSTLTFNPDKLTCQSYTNTNPNIEDSLEVLLFPAEGRIEIRWSDQPVTLTTNTKLLDIVFEASTTGGSLIEWDGTTGACAFFNSSGTQIPVIYRVGEVIIFKEVYFSLNDKEVCEGETVILTPSLWSSNGQVEYNWTYPDGSTSQNQSLVLNEIGLSEEGNYTIKITDTAGCYLESATNITVFESPWPQFAIEDTIYTQDPIDLDAGYGFLHYWWNTGDTTQSIWVENEGWYLAEVESQQGCIGKDSSYVIFSTTPEPVNMYFPNAFTPNGDGLNDEFKVVTPSYDLEVFSLSIFNRWGAMIFHTTDISQGWDGTYQGSPCQAGTYVFKVTYNTSMYSNAAPEAKMGTVMLVR